MGLKSFLKKFFHKEEETIQTKLNMDFDDGIFDCFVEVYRKEISKITGISIAAKIEIFSIISETRGGFLNYEAYKDTIYDQFFRDRTWDWVEYNHWHDKFSKLGRFPTSFRPKGGPLSTEAALIQLTDNQLKFLLRFAFDFDLDLPKHDLVNLAKTISGIKDHAMVREKFSEAMEKEMHSIYSVFMHTMISRAMNLHENNQALRMGVKEFELVHAHQSDAEFAQMAIDENPKAIPPFFPYDRSSLKPNF